MYDWLFTCFTDVVDILEAAEDARAHSICPNIAILDCL